MRLKVLVSGEGGIRADSCGDRNRTHCRIEKKHLNESPSSLTERKRTIPSARIFTTPTHSQLSLFRFQPIPVVPTSNLTHPRRPERPTPPLPRLPPTITPRPLDLLTGRTLPRMTRLPARMPRIPTPQLPSTNLPTADDPTSGLHPPSDLRTLDVPLFLSRTPARHRQDDFTRRARAGVAEHGARVGA
jgi:hypothetical protein